MGKVAAAHLLLIKDERMIEEGNQEPKYLTKAMELNQASLRI